MLALLATILLVFVALLLFAGMCWIFGRLFAWLFIKAFDL